MAESYRLLIPHYCHHEQFAPYFPKLVAHGLPITIVDDGSTEVALTALKKLIDAHRDADVELIEHGKNLGKGEAVITGLNAAAAHGASHVVTVDADGQHDADDIPNIIDASKAAPDSLFSGQPIFAKDIPTARLYGREITNVLARIATGNAGLRDAMCGFRVYPVTTTLQLARKLGHRKRMELDVEILVRASWAGVPVQYYPTKVAYPETGRSHFRMVLDNVRLTAMHTQLLAVGLGRWLRQAFSTKASDRSHTEDAI